MELVKEWVRVPENAPVQQLAVAVSALSDVVIAVLAREHMHRADSPGGYEIRSCSGQVRAASTRSVLAGALPLLSAVDHARCACLITGTNTRTGSVAVATLARAALENAGLSMWLAAPDLAAVDRIERHLALRARGCWERSRLGGDTSETVAEIHKDARAAGIPFTVSASGKTKFREIPARTELAADVGGTGGLTLNEYRLLSAVTHGESHGIDNLLNPVARRSAGIDEHPFDLDPRVTAVAFDAIIHGLSAAAERAFSLWGWPTGEIESARNTALALLPLLQ